MSVFSRIISPWGRFPASVKSLLQSVAVSGPGVLYKVIEAIIAGEVRNRGAVIATAKEEPFEFYTMTLIVGSGAAFVTALGVAAFLVLILKGRPSRSE